MLLAEGVKYLWLHIEFELKSQNFFNNEHRGMGFVYMSGSHWFIMKLKYFLLGREMTCYGLDFESNTNLNIHILYASHA